LIRPEEYRTLLAQRPWSCADVSLVGTKALRLLVLSTGSQTPSPHVRLGVLVISPEQLESFSNTFSASFDGHLQAVDKPLIHSKAWFCIPTFRSVAHHMACDLRPNPITGKQIDYGKRLLQRKWIHKGNGNAFSGQSTDTFDRASGHRTSSRRV
jgi:hypothetical protein